MHHSLKQLLVHLDATAASSRRLAAAREIARAHDAAVTALYAVMPALLDSPLALEAGPSVAWTLQEMDDDRRKAARALFDQAQASSGTPAAWAQTRDFPIIGAFAHQAFYADLMVLGQHDASDVESAGVPADFVESVIVASGKPALVLPCEGGSPFTGETAVIAWKPTREAARAVSAALPLLQRARRVHVLSWAQHENENVDGASMDLGSFLKLRGIEPAWHAEAGSEPEFLGELLLSRAFDLDADLLVMGCYGHSRAREWVLGGTTRTILQSMTLPVLMAH
jgi:nucleotide-binding universal stress UspA family protein